MNLHFGYFRDTPTYRARDAMKTNKAGSLFGKLNAIGETLQNQLENSADEFNAEIEQLGEKLKELSDQVESEAAEGLGFGVFKEC